MAHGCFIEVVVVRVGACFGESGSCSQDSWEEKFTANQMYNFQSSARTFKFRKEQAKEQAKSLN